jgi:hypothetical protein
VRNSPINAIDLLGLAVLKKYFEDRWNLTLAQMMLHTDGDARIAAMMVPAGIEWLGVTWIDADGGKRKYLLSGEDSIVNYYIVGRDNIDPDGLIGTHGRTYRTHEEQHAEYYRMSAQYVDSFLLRFDDTPMCPHCVPLFDSARDAVKDYGRAEMEYGNAKLDNEDYGKAAGDDSARTVALRDAADKVIKLRNCIRGK